jgi:ubiquinone/menaquinone biosynthesis C-methylase UbiE
VVRGTYGLLLSQAGNEVIGLDISVNNIKAAHAKAKTKHCPFFGVVGDLEKMPFKDSVFSVALSAYMLHHFPDITLLITEIHVYYV